MGPLVSNCTQPNFHCCPLDKKRVEKYLPSEFPQSKAAIGSQLYMPKARCFTKHKSPAPNCFPCDTQRAPCKKEGKRERGRVRVSKHTHTHTHTHTPKTVEEKIHWVTCPPVTLIDWSKVFWSLRVPILQLEPVVILLMKFTTLPPIARACHNPYLNPPKKEVSILPRS
jgi:hypothetical protein